ncbi:MAG: hypothetical protein AAGA93_24000 [Actinomycetota bacterium]
MKDFSLLHSRVRAWLPVLAMAAIGMILFLNQGSDGAEPDCPAGGTAVSADCPVPLPVRGELLVDDQVPISSPMAADADDEPSAWDRATRSGRDVPFVSLQPSPEPMTDAGEELVRSTSGEDDG